MASFQAKIGWKRQRKRQNKNYLSVSFKKLQKNSKNCKKIQKIEKYHYSFISSQNRLDMAEKERK